MLEALVSADVGENLETAHVGHHEIEEHDVGAFALKGRNRLAGIGGQHEMLVTGILQKDLNRVERDRLVVDQHDAGAPQQGRVTTGTPG